MGKREHQARTHKRPQWKQDETGIEITWGFETRVAVRQSGYL